MNLPNAKEQEQEQVQELEWEREDRCSSQDAPRP